jgi:hypothetical protein
MAKRIFDSEVCGFCCKTIYRHKTMGWWSTSPDGCETYCSDNRYYKEHKPEKLITTRELIAYEEAITANEKARQVFMDTHKRVRAKIVVDGQESWCWVWEKIWDEGGNASPSKIR